jgi:hypothetical protein
LTASSRSVVYAAVSSVSKASRGDLRVELIIEEALPHHRPQPHTSCSVVRHCSWCLLHSWGVGFYRRMQHGKRWRRRGKNARKGCQQGRMEEVEL